ncbi:MAG TPA: hypothetical protein VES91_00985, partial [Burkholderiaceae bacterium]|nr:hypothetical protein [Burkholderiaceae bacterium]
MLNGYAETGATLRSVVAVLIVGCMLAASAGVQQAYASSAAAKADTKAQATKTIAKAKATNRVRGTIPAGRAP